MTNYSDMKKPPLGVKPAYIHAAERIKDLADAISRNAMESNTYYLRIWANEMVNQIALLNEYKPVEIRRVGKTGPSQAESMEEYDDDE